MARTRTTKQSMGLPKYVYHSKGRYVFRPYNPETKRKGKEIVLCKDTASMSELWARYEQVTQQQQEKTIRWAIDTYLASKDFMDLSRLSIRDGRQHAKQIIQTPMLSGAVFGDIQFATITTGMLQKYLDKRSESSPVAGNKEIGFLSTVYNWHKRRDNVTHNPASGVKKNKTKPRDRYVTDKEYEAALLLAKSGPHYLYPMMEIAYLCRARRVELLQMRKDQITKEGLLLNRAKGSKTQIIEISPRLQKAINACNTAEQIRSVWLIHDKKGQKIRDESFKSSWARMMKKLKEQGYEGFTFHDLKAKGVSDFDGDKLKASGHKTQSMLNVYDRKLDIVEATK